MKLSYRGCQYHKQTVSLAIRNNSINAKYRGINYILEQGKMNIAHPNLSLKYRGISYQAVRTSSIPQTSSNFSLNSAMV